MTAEPSITSPSSATAAAEELMMLFHESAAYCRDPAIRQVLSHACNSLHAIHRRLKLAHKRYVVAVVGLTNVGKSTLLNALLGCDVAPRRNGPCTAAPIEFVAGERLLLTAHYRDSASRRRFECDSPESLHQRLAEFAAEDGAGAGRTLERVQVELPSAVLQHGLVIADTPGFGAAQTGSSAGSHEEAVTHYLKHQASQVFWVVLADQGIGKREIDFYDATFAALCDDVVVTGSEDWSEADRARFRQRFESEFSERIPTFHFVSGLLGLHSRQANDDAGLVKAGITSLELRIQELARPEGRVRSLIGAMKQLADDVAFWFREREIAPAARWRPDSRARWRRAAQSGSVLHRELLRTLEEAHA